MGKDSAIVIFHMHKRKITVDLEIPLYITANELVSALNAAYNLGIDTTNVKNCYLTAENPVALLKGNRLLADFGIHNGTIIHLTEA